MMSYDPSSLNRNKTLLEAIEEVKKFLIANPCYKVFYANTNYVIGTTTYSKTYIDDPDSIAEYDVVFFNNNYYGKVESVGDSTFTIIGATNFKGDTGAQGDPGTPGTPGADGQDGTDGTDGISITNVSIDMSNHLICTLSNGTTIDAGLIPSAVNDHYVYLTASSGTLTADELTKLQYSDSVILTTGGVYYRGYTTLSNTLVFEMFDTTGNQTKRLTYTIDTTTRAYTFANAYLPIVKDNINSQTATSGQVLSADGIGGASWQTPSGYQNSVLISTTSGTFTDDEYAKLGYGDSTIIYDDGSIKTTYKLKLETASILEFECIDASSKNNLKLIDVNKTTKAYSMTSVAMIKSATFDSGTATSGKVLTANGSGGTSWETAGGGSLYVHTINFTRNSTNSKIEAQFEILSTSSTLLTSLQISQYLNANYRDSKYKMCSGVYWDGTDFFSIASVFNNSGVVAVRYLNASGNVWVFSINDGILTFTDQGAVLVS